MAARTLGRPSGSRGVAGTGAPRDIPSPSPMLSLARSNYPAAVPKPPAAPGPPLRHPRVPGEVPGTKRAGGRAEIERGLPRDFAALQGISAARAALEQWHWGEGMPPGSDARVLS